MPYLSLKETAKSQAPFEEALRRAPSDKFRLKVYRALLPAYTLLPEIDKKVEALEFIITKTDSQPERSLSRTALLSFKESKSKMVQAKARAAKGRPAKPAGPEG